MRKNDPQTAAKLTPEQVENIMQSEQSFATYLSTLSPEQVRDLKASIKNHGMEPNVLKALMALLDLAEYEAVRNEAELKEKLMPMAKRLAVCLELHGHITALEAITRSL